MDPRCNGFSHGNPQLGQGDEMWYQSLAIDQIIEEQFCPRDLSPAESEFMRLIRMGIINGREGFNYPTTASIRLMRYSAAVTMRLWAMLDNE